MLQQEGKLSDVILHQFLNGLKKFENKWSNLKILLKSYSVKPQDSKMPVLIAGQKTILGKAQFLE